MRIPANFLPNFHKGRGQKKTEKCGKSSKRGQGGLTKYHFFMFDYQVFACQNDSEVLKHVLFFEEKIPFKKKSIYILEKE